LKSLIRSLVITAIGIYLVTLLIPGIRVSGGWQSYAWAAAALTIFNATVKPIANLLLLPINLLTLGMFRWVVNVFILWLVPAFVKEVTILPFAFPGYNAAGFAAPAMNLSVFWTAAAGAFILSIVTGVMEWILD
jgi:putative membrane protein